MIPVRSKEMEKYDGDAFVIETLLYKGEIGGIIGTAISDRFVEKTKNKGLGWVHCVKGDGSIHTNWGLLFTGVYAGKRIITGICINGISMYSICGIKVRKSKYWEAQEYLESEGYGNIIIDGYRLTWEKENTIFEILTCETGEVVRCLKYVKRGGDDGYNFI